MEIISDKIISAFDERFDKLESILRAIQTMQRELNERVEIVEGQASDLETSSFLWELSWIP